MSQILSCSKMICDPKVRKLLANETSRSVEESNTRQLRDRRRINAGLCRKEPDILRPIQSHPTHTSVEGLDGFWLLDGSSGWVFRQYIRTNTNHPKPLWEGKHWMGRRLSVLNDPSRPILPQWESTLRVRLSCG